MRKGPYSVGNYLGPYSTMFVGVWYGPPVLYLVREAVRAPGLHLGSVLNEGSEALPLKA